MPNSSYVSDQAASMKATREKQKKHTRENKLLLKNIRSRLKDHPDWTDEQIAVSVSKGAIPSWRFPQIVSIASQERAKRQRDQEQQATYDQQAAWQAKRGIPLKKAFEQGIDEALSDKQQGPRGIVLRMAFGQGNSR